MHLYRVIKGLRILLDADTNSSICAEHDQIFAGSSTPLSPEDAARMEELGWSRESDGDGWVAWV